MVSTGSTRRWLVERPVLTVGLALVLIIVLTAAVAPLLPLRDPNVTAPARRLAGAGVSGYLLGSDQLGRDILSRLIWSTQISMLVGFVPVTIIFLMGVTIGLVAGYYGGWTDQLLMRLTDVIYAFPDLLFLFIIMATLRNTAIGDLQGGLLLIFVAIAIVNWVGMARLVRGQVLALKEREFVEAARAIGAPARRIMSRHLFPNILPLMIVLTMIEVGQLILQESAISFIGFGIQPPTPSWGNMLTNAAQYLGKAPYLIYPPCVAVFVTVLCLYLVGDGLRDALDPRLKSR